MFNWREHPVLFPFVILVLIYLTINIIFITQLVVSANGSSNQDKKHAVEYTNAKVKRDTVAIHLIDQLKENKSAYNNNVWTTLATLVAAIGMVLGSDKFQRIIRSDKQAVWVIEGAVVLLFAVHAYAYYFYLVMNSDLMDFLENFVDSLLYYQGYKMRYGGVILNLVFDTALFLLLSYIILHIRQVEEQG